jgi:hypothetical protein
MPVELPKLGDPQLAARPIHAGTTPRHPFLASRTRINQPAPATPLQPRRYDFLAYAYFGPVISRLFFPNSSQFARMLAYWGIFAAGACVVWCVRVL